MVVSLYSWKYHKGLLARSQQCFSYTKMIFKHEMVQLRSGVTGLYLSTGFVSVIQHTLL